MQQLELVEGILVIGNSLPHDTEGRKLLVRAGVPGDRDILAGPPEFEVLAVRPLLVVTHKVPRRERIRLFKSVGCTVVVACGQVPATDCLKEVFQLWDEKGDGLG